MISLICGSDGHLTTLGDTSSNSVPPTVFTKMSVVILTASLILQGEVKCMSCVEAFANGIKIESSDQSPFQEPIKFTSELRTRTHDSNLTFNP